MASNLPAQRAQATVISSRHERYYERKPRTYTSPDTSQDRADTRNRRATRNTNIRDYSPTRLADKSTEGIGLLEAEFLVTLLLLVMIMFSSPASYSDKIMSLMKRGTLTCLLFFILALVASVGPNAAKLAKAFGGLVVVAILITAPVGTVFKGLDNVIKNDWIGTGETGGTVPSSGSSDTGTQGGTGGGPSAVQQAWDQLGQWLLHLPPGDFSKETNIIKSILGKLHL